MRMVVLAYPVDDTCISQCLLYREGVSISVGYHSNGQVSKYRFITSRGYDMLLEVANSALLELL